MNTTTTTTAIYNDLGTLVFSSFGEVLASRKDYETADRCTGSIFEALAPDEFILLEDGKYLLDEDLDLIPA